MNPLEFAKAFAALFNASMTATGLYLTVVSGYLITAYAVGAKLARSQLIIISGLFVVFSLLMSFTAFSLSERAIQLEVELEGRMDALDLSIYLFLAAHILGVAGALKFMNDIRIPK